MTYSFTHSLTHLLARTLTHSTEESSSWVTNRSSGSQEIPRILRNQKVVLQVPATCPYPEPDQSSLGPPVPLPEDPP